MGEVENLERITASGIVASLFSFLRVCAENWPDDLEVEEYRVRTSSVVRKMSKWSHLIASILSGVVRSGHLRCSGPSAPFREGLGSRYFVDWVGSSFDVTSNLQRIVSFWVWISVVAGIPVWARVVVRRRVRSRGRIQGCKARVWAGCVKIKDKEDGGGAL
jgi:hypothetical protein